MRKSYKVLISLAAVVALGAAGFFAYDGGYLQGRMSFRSPTKTFSQTVKRPPLRTTKLRSTSSMPQVLPAEITCAYYDTLGGKERFRFDVAISGSDYDLEQYKPGGLKVVYKDNSASQWKTRYFQVVYGANGVAKASDAFLVTLPNGEKLDYQVVVYALDDNGNTVYGTDVTTRTIIDGYYNPAKIDVIKY